MRLLNSSSERSTWAISIVSYLLNLLPPFGSIAQAQGPGKESLCEINVPSISSLSANQDFSHW
jgi:hypothetical protein